MDNTTTSSVHAQKCFAMWNKHRDSLDYNVYMSNAVINFVFCVPTTAINMILFTAVWRTSTLRTPSNILLCALAGTDMCVGLTVQPSYGTLMLSNAIDTSQTVKCVALYFHRILSNTFAVMSFLSFTAISVDKLLMIHLHLRYNTVVTNDRTKYALLVLLAISSVTTAVSFFNIKIYLVILFFLVSTCFIIAFISYTKIYRTVIRHQQEIHDQAMAVATRGNNNRVLELARFKKRSFSMMCIYSVFLLFYLPFICTTTSVETANNKLSMLALKYSAVTFAFFNSLVNPILIYWKMRDIRNAVRRLIFHPISAE